MAELATLFPPEIGGPLALALIGASFGTSFLTAAFGIGGGAVLLGILASLMPPAALIPVHGVVQLGSNTGRAVIMRRHLSTGVFAAFGAGSLIGVSLGGLIAVDLPPAGVQIGVGAFILWSVLAKPPAFLAQSGWLAGTVSSFLTMFFGATGPFVAAYIKTLGLDRMTFVATHAACMTAQHLLKVLAFGLLGFAFGPWIVLICGMVACGFAGTVVGKRVLMRINDKLFGRVLNAILIVLAVRLILVGAAEFIGEGDMS